MEDWMAEDNYGKRVSIGSVNNSILLREKE